MFRARRTIDHLREPSLADLVRYTNGHEDVEEFNRTGAEVVTMLDLGLQRHGRAGVAAAGRLLDFGCGAGRLSRLLAPVSELYGCDVNAPVIDHCRKTIPSGRFVVNDLMPPLPYQDDSFDTIVSFSVFSHLRHDVEAAWLRELSRVAAPGCLLLITVQGEWMIEATLDPVDQEKARAKGFLWREVHTRHGGQLDFPDYYESSYHTHEWIRDHWQDHFTVLEIIKGDDPRSYLPPGQDFAPVGAVEHFRPMGQDLIIARR